MFKLTMIVSKELVVSNRKKVDIVEELRQKKFRPFPKVAKAKAAGETEGAEEGANDEAEEATTGGTSTDYDYLLGMESHEREGAPRLCVDSHMTPY
jgi:DNA topoisomerase II